MLKFTKNHEWLLFENETVTVGVTDFAQSQLGDIVFVELPEIDSEHSVGDEGAVIESVKAAGEIDIPIAGTIIEVNEALSDDPEIINRDPMGEGWFFKMRVENESESAELMTETEYQALIAE